MNTNKKIKTIAITYLFFALAILYPQLGHANNHVDILEPMYTVSDYSRDIEMVAMGASYLGNGKFKISLLLKNNKQYEDETEYATLDNDYELKVFDSNDKEYQTIIDKSSIKYSSECSNEIISRGCLVTLEATIEESIPEDTSFEEYDLSVPYSNGVTGDIKPKKFFSEEVMRDIEISYTPSSSYIWQLISPASSSKNEILKIKNTSEDTTIEITKASILSKHISINTPIKNTSLKPEETLEIEFEISENTPKTGSYDEYLSITYEMNGFNEKTIKIPIKITRTTWWNDYGTSISIIIGTAITAVTIAAGTYIYYHLENLSFMLKPIMEANNGEGSYTKFNEWLKKQQISATK